MKKLTLSYLDTCLPDYFQGFAGQTYAVPLPAKPRNGEVLKALHFEIESQEIWYDSDELVTADVYEMVHKEADQMFREMDLRKGWSKTCDDLSACYAYFGLKEEEEE